MDISSETDTSLDSSELLEKLKLQKRKSNKKQKKSSDKNSKKPKKNKKHKSKKKMRRSSISSGDEKSSIQTKVPTTKERDVNVSAGAYFFPELPPHLLKNKTEKCNTHSQCEMIGPVLPNDEIMKSSNLSERTVSDAVLEECGSDDEKCTFGPMPHMIDANQHMTKAQMKLEERALELKLAGLDGSKNAIVEREGREEWMLELPEVGLKGGLSALSNMKRKFHHGKERPDFSDRSSWTRTPQDGDKPPKTTKRIETLQHIARVNFEKERDKEQERQAKKHKRESPLIEQHKKKLEMEQKKKEKEHLASREKVERRPFSRDVDLKLNKIDKNQTKQIVDKAKIFHSKFSSGHTKYL